MIDFHTHILPAIDDGSRDTETSLEMVRMMIAQKIDAVAATPHYYCLDCTPGEHRKKAENAYGQLVSAWNEKYPEGPALPEIRIGAEIYVANSLETVEDPQLLKISGTDLMLFEMPFTGYREWIPRLVELVAGKAGAIPVFAHIDRYEDIYGKEALGELERIPRAAFQFNSDSFEDRRTLKYMFSLIKRGFTIFWGSDCHGAHHRVPDLGNALPELRKKIGKKFSPEICSAIEERQNRLLRNN